MKGERQKAGGRRQEAEGRRQKAEGRRQKAEGRRPAHAEDQRTGEEGEMRWRGECAAMGFS
jgi:hypothetical protein